MATGTLLIKTVLRGYHVYMVVWEPLIGETFVALHESGTDHVSPASPFSLRSADRLRHTAGDRRCGAEMGWPVRLPRQARNGSVS